MFIRLLSSMYDSHREITMYGNTCRKYGFPVSLGFRHLSCIRYHYIFACISVLVQFYMLYIQFATKFYHSNKMTLASSLKRFCLILVLVAIFTVLVHRLLRMWTIKNNWIRTMIPHIVSSTHKHCVLISVARIFH